MIQVPLPSRFHWVLTTGTHTQVALYYEHPHFIDDNTEAQVWPILKHAVFLHSAGISDAFGYGMLQKE